MLRHCFVQRLDSQAAPAASRPCRAILRAMVGALLAFVVAGASPALADIYYDYLSTSQGQVIPGTQGITPGPGIDLSGWNTLGHQLEFANLQYINLTNASFATSDLANASFNSSTLTNANFTNATLTNSNLSFSTLTNANFSGAIVKGAFFAVYSPSITTDFTASQLYSTASYASSDLTGIDLEGNDLTGWNFANQNLTNAGLQSPLTNANFTNANLTHAYLDYSTLTDANFSGAIVKGASFDHTTSTGFTASQLYSTASYASGDLTGIAT